MKRTHNELAIGITVTVATLLVVMAILLLGKSSVITVGMQIDMLVPNAAGLGTGDQVLYRGIPIGTVQSVVLKKNRVGVALKLRGDPEIPVDSRFLIRESSLLGGKSVVIESGSSTKMLQANAQVTGHAESGILSMAEGSSGVTSKVSEILSNINTLSGDQTAKSIYTTLQSLNNLTRALQGIVDENKAAVSATLSNLQKTSRTADDTMGNLDAITSENRAPIRKAIESVNETTAELQAAINETNATVKRLNAILTSLQQGQGSLGKLMVDDSLYRETKDTVAEINTTVAEINTLVKDIKQNPKKYVTFKLF